MIEYADWNAGGVVAEYIRGSDMGGGVGGILYSVRPNGFPTVSYAHYNHRGDVATRTSGGGTIDYQASYEAFGQRTGEEGHSNDPQRANTKDEDPTGLLNEGFRYRDLATGTFITRDPAGFVDGPNLYAYVRQNPWSKFDPEGLSEEVFSEDPVAKVRSAVNKLKFWARGGEKFGGNNGPVRKVADKAVDVAVRPLERGIAAADAAQRVAGATTGGAGLTASEGQPVNPVDVVSMMTAVEAAADAAAPSAGGSPDGKTAQTTAIESQAESAVTTAPQGYGPLPPGEAPYQLKLFPDEAFDRTTHYGHSPTAAQRRMASPGSFDHNPPLVQHYWEGDGQGGVPGFNLTQTERLRQARSLDGQVATQQAQDIQGGVMSRYSTEKNKQFGDLRKPKR